MGPMLERGRGFVLRTWPLRESDLIVSAFTLEHGRIRGVARGALKPKGRWAGALEPMTEVALEWRLREGQDLATLSDGSILRSPYHPRPDFEGHVTLSFIAELVDETQPPHAPDPVLHRLLGRCLDALAARHSAQVLARYATAWVLRLHGVLPDPTACAGCGRELRPAGGGTWQWRLHGLACERCGVAAEAGPVLLPDDIEFLEAVRRLPPEQLAEPAAPVLRRTGAFLRALLRETLGRELKSDRFL